MTIKKIKLIYSARIEGTAQAKKHQKTVYVGSQTELEEARQKIKDDLGWLRRPQFLSGHSFFAAEPQG